MSEVKAIAFHLPQFHPIPENDAWWGQGFTEWANVTKARALFRGHYQPHLPADLGFYDLRLPEARLAQADLAREYGLHGFCYYHYWFNGRRVLERPVDEILASGEPDFPFCLCWANENWNRGWDGCSDELLLQQNYSEQDDIEHIRSLIRYMLDRRYILVNGKPLLLVYRVDRLPDPSATAARWRNEAERAGLLGLYLVRVECCDQPAADARMFGFDASLEFQPRWPDFLHLQRHRRKWWHRKKIGTHESGFADNHVYDYREFVETGANKTLPAYPFLRSVCPAFDNTARRKNGAMILHDSSPEVYERWLELIANQSRQTAPTYGIDSPIVFINAWNEWAEGNHLEPCQRWGRAYLDSTRRALLAAST